MSFNSLSRVLGALNQEGWPAQKQFQQLLKCWPEIVGPAVAAQTRPVSIQRDVLRVATSSSAWSQNLSFERHRILEKLNARLSTSFIDIRFTTAQWQDRNDSSQSSGSQQQATVWREHPSRLGESLPTSQIDQTPVPPKDPNAAFQRWAQSVQTRSQQLPLCPQCKCPTPTGELKRWSVCALCAAKAW